MIYEYRYVSKIVSSTPQFNFPFKIVQIKFLKTV